MDVSSGALTVKSKKTEQRELTELDRLIDAAFERGDLNEAGRLLDRKAGSRVHTVAPTFRLTKADLEAGLAEVNAWQAKPFEERFPNRTEENPLDTPEFQHAYKAARIQAAQAVEDEDLPIPEDDLDEARDELFRAFEVIRSELIATGRSETELRLLGRIAGLEDWLAEQRAEFLAAIRDAVETVKPAADNQGCCIVAEDRGLSDEIPPDLLNPGGFLRDLYSWYLDQSAIPQPEFALSAAIATIATLTGQKIEEPSGERTNLYLLNLGVTCSGKEAPAGLVERVLDSAGLGDRVMSRAASGAGLLSALRKQAVRLFNWDEFGIALKSISDNRAGPWQREIVANLLSLFTRANGVFRGAAYSDAEHDANREIYGPHVVLLGSSTPETFYSGLTSEAIESGLLGRCLMFVGDPKRLMNRDMVRESVPVEITSQATAWIERAKPPGNLAGIIVKPMRFAYTDQAGAELRAWGEKVERQKIAADGWRRAILGRVEQIGKRLSLLHAASVGPDSKAIDVGSVRWGSRLAEFLMNRLARHAEQNIGVTGYQKDLEELIAFISKRGAAGASRRDISRAFRGFKLKELGDLLMHATEAGRVALAEQPAKGRGRPSYVYVATGD